jgi:opacity protein-like surface antigen
MKNLILLLGIALFIGSTAVAQKSRNFRGNKRGDFFGGAQDYRDITKHGLQISFGPNYTLTKGKNDVYSGADEFGRPMNTIIDPAGSLGAFINIGMAHYRLKESRFWGSLAKKNPDGFFGRRVKSNLFHRFDWGLGFDYIGGRETTTVELYNPFNELVSSEDTKGSFYNGYLTGRFTADRFTKVGDNWHLETGIGVNFNYNLLSAPKESYSGSIDAPLRFQKDFMAQIHGHVGMNYRIRKGDYLTFGFFLPAVGVYEMNKLKPTVQWFSSNYYPAHLQIKWIHHFTKKAKGCNTPGSEEDRKRNEEFLQNN